METEDKGLAALIIHLAGPLIWFLRHQREKPNPTFGKEIPLGNAAWHEGSRDLLSSWKRGEGLLLIDQRSSLGQTNLWSWQRCKQGWFFLFLFGAWDNLWCCQTVVTFSRVGRPPSHKGRMGSIPITIRLGRSLREQNTLLDQFAF